MGKSNKKAKSDRINLLRQQYDAFLEQDKKRKERNEYILGKLDKMRYSTALVPIRHKLNILDNSAIPVHHLGYQHDASPIRDIRPTVQNQNIQYPNLQIRRSDETSIIEEISKKYILIPKTTSLLANIHPQTRIQNSERPLNAERFPEQYPVRDIPIPVKDEKLNVNDSSDWRSKYEILNILKNEEKDSSKHKTGADDLPALLTDKKAYLSNKADQVDSNNTYAPKNQVGENFYDLPEKETSTPIITAKDMMSNAATDKREDSGADIRSNLEDHMESVSNKLHDMKIDHEKVNVTTLQPVDMNNYETQLESEEHQYQTATNGDVTSQDNYIDETSHPETHNFVTNEQNVMAESGIPAVPEQNVYTEDYDVNQPHLEELNTEVPVENSPDYNTQNQTEPTVENYVQEEIPNENIQMEPTYNTEVLAGTVATHIDDRNPAYEQNYQEETVIEQTENPAEIPASTEEFQAESNDAYYKEQVGADYTYQQQGEYPQGQEYGYYDGTQPEVYSEEANQGEVTQMYDPNYQQQYETTDQNYGEGPTEEPVYEQDPQAQHYQETEGYQQPQPEYDVTQYDQQNYETQGQDGQLHYEEGYTEQQHIAEVGEHQVGEVYEGQNIEGVMELPIEMTQEFQQPATEQELQQPITQESVAAPGDENVQMPAQNMS